MKPEDKTKHSSEHTPTPKGHSKDSNKNRAKTLQKNRKEPNEKWMLRPCGLLTDFRKVAKLVNHGQIPPSVAMRYIWLATLTLPASGAEAKGESYITDLKEVLGVKNTEGISDLHEAFKALIQYDLVSESSIFELPSNHDDPWEKVRFSVIKQNAFMESDSYNREARDWPNE